MPKFALRYPFFIIMISLIVLLVGVVNVVAHAGRSLSFHRYSRRRGRHLLLRHAPAADRSRHHRHLRALLHPAPRTSTTSNRARSPASASSRFTSSPAPMPTPRSATSPTSPWPTCAACRPARCRPSCSASTHPASPSAWSRSRARASTKPSSRTSASSRFATRSRTCPAPRCPQPYGGKLSPDSDLRRSAQARSAQLSLMDVVDRVNRVQPHPARRRRAHRPQGLQHLHQQPDPQHRADQLAAAQDGRATHPCSSADIGQAEDAGAIQNQHRPHRRPALRLSAHPQAGRQQQHHRRSSMASRAAVKRLVDIPKRSRPPSSSTSRSSSRLPSETW